MPLADHLLLYLLCWKFILYIKLFPLTRLLDFISRCSSAWGAIVMWIFWLLSFHQREIHVSLHSLPRVPTSFVTKVGHGFSHWVSSHCKHWFHMKCISSNANAPHIRLFYQWHAQCAMLGDIFKLAMGRPWEMPCHPWSHCQRCCCAPLDRECPRSCLPCNICSLQLAQLHAQQSPAARCLHFAALTLLLALTMTLTLTNLVDTDIDNYIVINDIDTLHVQCSETVTL